jgi:hypothetical protein
MPHWFKPYELGFKEGPTILFVFKHVDEINRAQREFLSRAERSRAADV